MVFFFRRAAHKKAVGKVVVFGATTAVGQQLSFLLKLCPHVTEVCCCSSGRSAACTPSRVSARGLTTDLSHIDTATIVRAIDDPNEWEFALRGTQLVLVCAGNNCEPLPAHRSIALADSVPEVMLAIDAVAKTSPKAIIGIVSNPTNALVPLAREVLLRHGVFDPRKLFGVTTLDVMRTRTLVAQELQMNPYDVNIPVVGGRGGATACPLVTQTGLHIPHERVVEICKKLQSHASPVSDDTITPTAIDEQPLHSFNAAPQMSLSLACAALEWSVSLLKALRGDRGIVECAFVESNIRKETPFFGSRVELGEEGVEKLLPLGLMTPYEGELVEAAVPLILEDVEAGLRFASGMAIDSACSATVQ